MAVVTIILYVLFLTSRDVISSSSSDDDYIPDVDDLDAPVPVLSTAQMAVFFLHQNISQRDLGREARQSICEKLLGEGLPDLVDKEYLEAYRMCRRHFNEFVVEHGQFICSGAWAERAQFNEALNGTRIIIERAFGQVLYGGPRGREKSAKP
jgi:hypothetical protein